MKKLAWIILFILIFGALPAHAAAVRVGTTYSPGQCGYLELEGKETYLAILDLKPGVMRLGAYWSEIEKEKDVYDFETLDWQIEEAAKRNVPVLLTVGMKAPRWPEYYIPRWVLDKAELKYGREVSKDPYLRERTLKFIREVMARYKNKSAIKWWQVENEPLDRSGANYWWIGKGFLKEEVELVRSLDPKKRPIVINVATYPNKFLHFLARTFAPTKPITDALPLCDILWLNIYPTVGHELMGFKMDFRTNVRERIGYFSYIVERVKYYKKIAWVTELQAEPWEPGEIAHVGEGDAKTASPEALVAALSEIRSLGIKTVLLWGSEYWYYRKTRYNDTRWWQAAESLLK